MIAAYQKRCQSRVDTALEALFQAPRSELERLYQAMRYSVMNGGKRVRPLLVYAACEALEGDLERADGAACAVELSSLANPVASAPMMMSASPITLDIARPL